MEERQRERWGKDEEGVSERRGLVSKSGRREKKGNMLVGRMPVRRWR